MKTLNSNYQRNVDILKENLKRGLTQGQANDVINGMEAQFKQAGLYDEEAREYINTMRKILIKHFLYIEVVEVK